MIKWFFLRLLHWRLAKKVENFYRTVVFLRRCWYVIRIEDDELYVDGVDMNEPYDMREYLQSVGAMDVPIEIMEKL